MTDSIASKYYISLKDQSNTQIAQFDDFINLHIEHRLNDVGNYTLTFADNGDSRLDLFSLDSVIEVYRSAPGLDLDWYVEFGGLHRKSIFEMADNGFFNFTSAGVDYNDLLARSTIAYKAGTIRADKDAPSETAMKEYVEENCGPTADNTVVGRLYQGGLTGFFVGDSTGYGLQWTGSRAYENLLDVLKDISVFSGIDFKVYRLANGTFGFVTGESQLGQDRTNDGIDRATGRNRWGNAPVIFAAENGNIRTITVEDDRTTEANVVIVVGKGDGSTRTTVTVSNPAYIDDSPLNRREITRTAGSYDEDFETYSLTTLGQEALKENQPKLIIEFEPLQQPSTFYGLHYGLGDKIVVKYRDIEVVKKIVGVTIDVQDDKENISIEFSDLTVVPS